ncbi:MAG: coniferyl aldehyde dehydrogenase [Pseudomonadales bacterium]|nr:coniferyl aldehyde dehydrogenase [Pseudomonadales bacterium]
MTDAMTDAAKDPGTDAFTDMQDRLDSQKRAQIAGGFVPLEQRLDRLKRCISILEGNGAALCDAMRQDFGHRSLNQSKMADIDGAMGPIKNAIKHTRHWMKSEQRSTLFPLNLFGSRSRIEYQPLGVIGCISPWNFPVQLTFAPLAGILAAGNRTMIKPSEFTPITSELMKRLIESSFDPDEIAVFTGGPEVGQAFSGLAFDHLLFTGATGIAKHVMRAAAENLVPVTLELGGKSPVIVGRSADMDLAARNIMNGKTMNAGQICLAPDYVMVPEESRDEFVDAARAAVGTMYPDLKDNPDYTSIVNERHYDRLQSYVDDARAKGAEVLEINPANEDFSQQEHHRVPPPLIVNPTEDMLVMQEEIFGPILPVKTYDNVEETIGYVNDHQRPLGLYYFGKDHAETRRVLDETVSGGVTLNDVIMHVAQEDLPFGGVGPSGMGSYHGIEGFKTFSHAKAIYTQSSLASKIIAKMGPPYKKKPESGQTA